MPVTFASLSLIANAANDAFDAYQGIADVDGSIKDRIARVRNLYEMHEIPNKVPDGSVPYPENQNSLEMGISIEFRCASPLLDLQRI